MIIKFFWQSLTYKGEKFDESILLVPILINDENYYLQLDSGAFTSFLYKDKLAKFSLFENEIKEGISNYYETTGFKGNMTKIKAEVAFSSSSKFPISFLIEEQLLDTNSNLIPDNLDINLRTIGLLGNDFFHQFDTCYFNFPKRQIGLNETLREPNFFCSSEFTLWSNLIMIPALINNANVSICFDTAASNLVVLSHEFLSNLFTDFRNLPFKRFPAPRSEQEVYLNQVNAELTLEIGGKSFKTLSFCYLDEDFNKEVFENQTEFECLMGNSIFKDHSVQINNKTKSLSIYK